MSTLVGVPTPAETIANASKHSYPAPPKWVKRSQRDDDPTQPELAVAVPVARIELRPNLGVSRNLPGVISEVNAPSNISDTIQQMLDEQSAVSLEVVDDEVPLDLALEAEARQLADSVPPSAADADGTRRSSVPPVIVPGHVAEAYALESEHVAEQLTIKSGRPERSARPMASLSLLDLHSSSLAPAEVAGRPRKQDDAAPVFGIMLVAAIALLAVGGWLVTAGGYQRSGASAPLAAAQPVAAAATAVPKPQPPAPAAPAPASVPEAVPAQEATEIAGPVVKAEPAAVAVAASVEPVRAKRASKRSEMPTRVQVEEPKPVVSITQRDTSGAAPGLFAEEESPEALPEIPSRDDVLARLEAMRSAVQACADGRTGVADLDVTIAGTGIITNVQVSGDFAGTPQGSCIARTVRQAKFPRFSKDRFRLLYPYSL